jgi:hypothetical protein
MHMQNKQSKLDQRLHVEARLGALFECPQLWTQDAVRFLIKRDMYHVEVEFLVLPYTGNKQEYFDHIIDRVFPSGLTDYQKVVVRSKLRSYTRTWKTSMCSRDSSPQLLTTGYLMECPASQLWMNI